MLTLNPPIRCGTKGAVEFSPPQWDGFLQSHSGEGKSEVFPYRNHPVGASPTHSGRLFVRAQPSASKDEAVQGTSLPCSCPPVASCLPPAHSSLALPSSTGKRGHTSDGDTDAEGVPISCSSPQDAGGCCVKQVFWGFAFTTLNFLTTPQRKVFFLLQSTTEVAGDWGLRSSMWEGGVETKPIQIISVPKS